jgi:magnesium chelatase family protein
MAVVHSRTIEGLMAEPVQVEVHLANGLPCLTLVGLADTAVREARERVRSALVHSGLGYPMNQRITVSLAPAALPKASSRFDLPIALGILAAQGLLDEQRLKDHEFAGELSLAGELRPVDGALVLALGMHRQAPDGRGLRRLVLPEGSAQEAAIVSGLTVLQARHLVDVVQALSPGGTGVPLAQAVPVRPGAPGAEQAPLLCLRDIRGQGEGKRALEVAAAGQHSLLLVGPPGTGKSMLAQRLPGLLPPLTEAQALDCAAVHSLAASPAGRRTGSAAIVGTGFGNGSGTGMGIGVAGWGSRPWRAPHHSCTPAALIGGGNPPRPGEISLANHGVLFLDELPEFPRHALEALREPLETGHVVISRAARQARYPCRTLLVTAMNPCPCGWLGSRQPGAPACRCTPDAVARYQGRLSGPLLDRIDLQLEIAAAAPADLLRAPDGEDSATVAQRVAQARQRQMARQGCLNAELDAAGLLVHARLEASAQAFAQRAAERLGLSGRSLHRALRVARTLADLADAGPVTVGHLAEALQFRRGLLALQGRGMGPATAAA